MLAGCKDLQDIFAPVAEQKQLSTILGDVSIMFYLEVLTDIKLSSLAFKYVWWLCNVASQLGWAMFSRIPFSICFPIVQNTRELLGEIWAEVEQQPFCSSHTLVIISCLTSLIWGSCQLATAPPSSGSAFGFSDTWARYVFNFCWRAQRLQDIHTKVIGNEN